MFILSSVQLIVEQIQSGAGVFKLQELIKEGVFNWVSCLRPATVSCNEVVVDNAIHVSLIDINLNTSRSSCLRPCNPRFFAHFLTIQSATPQKDVGLFDVS